MYISYNGFDFAPAECNLNLFRIEPRRSERGFNVTNIVEAHCSGEFCLQPGQDEYDLAIRIQEMLTALKDGGDFALRHTDGTNTPYQILNSDPLNLTGAQVTHFDGPANANGEWATGAAFRFVIRAEYSAAQSLILNYSETIEHQGDTGPIIQWGSLRQDVLSQIPSWRVISPQSTQTIIQEGIAETLGTYLLPPDPILQRPYLLGHRTVITRSTPRRYPRGVTGYKIRWHYEMISPVAFPAFPTTR